MTNNYLSDLINAGPDAFSNIFKVEISDNVENNTSDLENIKYSTRISNFSTPEKTQATIKLPYQNTYINAALPALSSFNKTTTFSFRIDENYKLYKWLQDSIQITSSGKEVLDDALNNNTGITVTVRAFTSNNIEVYSWKFLNCRFIRVSSITYSYDSASLLTVQADFIWSDLEEGIYE